ncbi:MAG: hypothetical protein EXS30_06390 [Pedosphaera sp.]|nr:hypothetical protein [Pedosphaera sp.]
MTFKRVFITSVALLASLLARAAVTPIYVNEGTLTEVPQVDATVFVNHGLFLAASPLAYQTLNTLIFTNTGTMTSAPGFNFATFGSDGVRTPAKQFYNDFDATIGSGFIEDLPFPIFQDDPTTANLTEQLFLLNAERPQILISAESIINRGYFRAGAAGLIRLEGGKIDLTRSGVGVEPFSGGRGSFTETNFFPESGIIDLHWGMNDASGQDGRPIPSLGPGSVASITQSIRAASPLHFVTNFFRPLGFLTSVTLTNVTAYVLTNAVSATNWLVQVVLVQSKDTNITTEVKFLRSSVLTNQYRTPVVKLATKETNVIDAASFLREVYLSDFMASETNFVLLTNLLTTITARPSTYDVTRIPPRGYLTGGKSNAVLTPQLLANPGYSNSVVTNVYSAYGFQVTNVQAALPAIPGVTATNLESRVEIIAQELDLNRARVRSDGAIVIKAQTLLPSSTNAVIDSANIILDVSNPAGTLKIENLVQEFVQRTAGNCFVWSAMWTNLLSGPAPPPPADPNAPAPEVPVIEIGFHVMLVDSQLLRDQAVVVKDFRAKSDEVIIRDVIRANDSFVVDAEKINIGLSSRVILGSKIQNLNSSNFPRAKTIENNGTLRVPGAEVLGSGGGVAIESLVNRGTNIAFNFDLTTTYFENKGVIQTDTGVTNLRNGTFTLRADTVKLEGGKLNAGAEVKITAKDLKIRAMSLTTADSLTFTIGNSISDGGPDAGTSISAKGVHLLGQPVLGDLLGTVIQSKIPKFIAIPHTWAGEDRGAIPAGFVNNAAIRRLILDGDVLSQFVFRGASEHSALYVDFLELKGSILTDINEALRIEPSMVIYFADSNVAPETLDGRFKDATAPQGRLRWVKDFIGPASAVDVISRVEKATVQMNRGLRESLTVDSDGDGVVNSLDLFPLDPDYFIIKAIALNDGISPASINLSWLAMPNILYSLEYTTDLSSGVWYSFNTYKNSNHTAENPTIPARVSISDGQRYYRIRIVE